jgi:hypothetical protein
VWTGRPTPESLSGLIPTDVHDSTQYLGSLGRAVPRPGGPVSRLRADRRPEVALPELEYLGRFSADGSFLLAPWGPGRQGSHGSALVDTRTGKMWVLPEQKTYHYISWSYGHLAVVLVHHDDASADFLLACDAVTHACDRLATRGEVLLPAS